MGELIYQWVKHSVARYGKKKWKAGIGRFGTNPIQLIGKEHKQNFLNSMITLPMRLKGIANR